jgi:hypothetical protein
VTIPRTLGAAIVAMLLLGACSGVGTLSFQAVSVPASTTTIAPVTPNYTSTALTPVPGVTTTTLSSAAGQATINGTVLGPQGAVPGATVAAERLVGDSSVAVEATTAMDGSFEIANVLGGRYSVRAWEAPSLAMTSPQIFFLAAGGSTSLTLQVSSFSGPDVAVSMRPSAPTVGQQANLALQVTNPTVGPDGIVRSLPVADADVELTDGPGWSILSASNPAATSSAGIVIFELACEASGSQPLFAAVNGAPATPLDLPDCISPPVTTTTSTVPPTTTTIPATATSTTSSVPL